MKKTDIEEVNLPQHLRSLAVQARLQALLEGLGIPHSATFMAKPVKEFYNLGQQYLYKLQGKEFPIDESVPRDPNSPEYDFTGGVPLPPQV